MKKSIYLFFFLIFANFSFSQQRMVVLPHTINYVGEIANSLKTLCIDLFEATPTLSDYYVNVLSPSKTDLKVKQIRKLGKKFKVVGTSDNLEMILFDKKETVVLATNTEAFYIGPSEGSVQARYREFINIKIEEFQARPFGKKPHEKLQNEIWEYDILKELGYLTNTGDVVEDFAAGVEKMGSDFAEERVIFKEIKNSHDEITDRTFMTYVAIYIKSVHHYNQYIHSNGKAFFIKDVSGSNEYLVFSGARKPIYRGSNIRELANEISKLMKENESAYITFESYHDQGRFLEALQVEMDNGLKKINVQEYLDHLSEIIETRTLGANELIQSEISSLTEMSYEKDYSLEKEILKIKFDNSDDLIAVLNDPNACEFSLCFSDGGMSIELMCIGISVEVSTSGELTLSSLAGDFSVDLSNSELEEGCDVSGSICIGDKDVTSSMSIECSDGNAITISMESGFLLSSENNSIKF